MSVVSAVDRLRILLVLHDIAVSGAPSSALNILEACRDQVEIRTIVPASGGMLGRAEALGPVTLLKPLFYAPTAIQRVRRRLAVSGLTRSIAEWKPDVIYINSIAALPVADSVSLPVGVPRLLHVHELDAVTRFLLKENSTPLAQMAHRFIAVSPSVEEMLTRTYRIPENQIALIPEAIADIDPESFRTPGTPFVVGGAGATEVRKAVVLWLQTAAEVISRLGPEAVRFRWVGAWNSFEGMFCTDIAQKLGVADSVEFVTQVSDPKPYFRTFDLLAMTSWEDPCPLVVSETMALGVPTVCFRNGGGAPYQAGDTGLIINRFSPVDMANGIVGLIQNPSRLAQLSKAARTKSEAFFASTVGPQVLEELRRICREQVS